MLQHDNMWKFVLSIDFGYKGTRTVVSYLEAIFSLILYWSRWNPLKGGSFDPCYCLGSI